MPTLPGSTDSAKLSLAEAVARVIREEVSGGRLGDGTRLPHENELIKHFGISRPTCREAIRILQSEGVLMISRGNGGGARVSTPEPERIADYAALPLRMRNATVRDTLEVRRLIEPTVAERHAMAPRAEVVSKLAQIAVAQRYVVEEPKAFLEHELEFRRQLLETCDSEPLRLFGLILDALVGEQWHKLHRRLPEHPKRASESQYAADVKIKLVELISAGKAEQAKAHWYKYLVDYEKGLLRNGGEDMLL